LPDWTAASTCIWAMKQRSSLLLATACAAAIRAGMLAASLALTAVWSATIALRAPLLIPAWHGAGGRGVARVGGGHRARADRTTGLAGAGAILGERGRNRGDAGQCKQGGPGRDKQATHRYSPGRSRLARTSEAPGARGLY
jgi:hypothetical protein